jgi:hypothetical protein
MRRIILGAALAISCTGAHAGGILMCDQFHCRSVVEFPPPIILPFPPVLSTQRPVYRAPPPPLQLAPRPPPRYAQQPQPPDADEAKGIENDIEGFCDQHPDEQFCSRLGKWLRDHPRGRP